MRVCADRTSYRLYNVGMDGSRTIAELISSDTAKRMLGRKSVTEALDCDGKTTCYLRFPSDKKMRGALRYVPPTREVDLGEAESERSNAAFSMREVNALAGTNFKYGRSRTARMTEAQRQMRRDNKGNRLREEDTVERAINKATHYLRTR